MPRRNNRAVKPRLKGRYESPEQRAVRQSGNARVQTVPIEQMVIPVGQCSHRHRKAQFPSESIARKALHQANLRHERRGEAHREVRVYLCPFCQHWHLTSRETWEDR